MGDGHSIRWRLVVGMCVAVAIVTGPLGPLSVYADTCVPALQAGCTPDSSGWCTSPAGPWFAGPAEERSASPWPQDVSGFVTSNNPNPVWSSSLAWVALENRHSSSCDVSGKWCIAQSGWTKWGGNGHGAGQTDGYAHYFAEWSNNDGFLNAAHIYGRTANSGTVSEHYEVYRYSDTDNHFEIHFPSGFVDAPSSVNWGPDSVVYSTEVQDYTAIPLTGSHLPGNATTKTKFDQMVWYDQNHTPETLVPTKWLAGYCTNGENSSCAHDTAGDTPTTSDFDMYYSQSGPLYFQIWDNRCT